jgi:hypothetical protein
VAELESLTAEDAVRLLSRAAGERYELVRRLAGGETGAHECAGPDGRRVVVKWELRPSAQALRRTAVGLTDRLREHAGWPVPRQYTVESDTCLFVIQDFMPGAPVERFTHSMVDRLLELHTARLGLERAEDESTWPDVLVPTLISGGVGYCLHEPLRHHDARSARLIERIEQIGRDLDPSTLPGGDIVYWDLHLGNLLAAGGELTATIDTDFVTTGDAMFDLTSLAVSALGVACEPGVRRRLLDAGVDSLDDTRRQAYVGHLLLRNLDWAIRKERVEGIVFWLDSADRLLAE